MTEVAYNLLPELRCKHCGNNFIGRSDFCCAGCESVYFILKSNHLEEYYQLKEEGYCFDQAKPVQTVTSDFLYLNNPEIRSRFVKADGTFEKLQLYIEGVHCVACLWLLENLKKLNSEILESRLQVGRSLLTIHSSQGADLAKITTLISKLGYKPHPIESEEKLQELQKKDLKKMLIKIGVAGMSSGNIMLLAISIYAGASGELARTFNWISFILYIPAVVFSAIPFYQTSWTSLKAKQMSIDVPVVLAIWAGTVVSVINLLKGVEHVYFDSLSALIFLLLSTRFLLKSLLDKSSHFTSLLYSLTPQTAHKKIQEEWQEVPIHDVKKEDHLKVEADEILPADGILLNNKATINQAFLTGESLPIEKSMGDELLAGSRNAGSALEITVHRTLKESRIGQILSSLAEEKKPNIVTTADLIAQKFIVLVLLAATATIGYFIINHNWLEGINRALAMLIVTCPCALAIAAPIAISQSLKRAYKLGAIIKDGETLERLSKVKNIFFDKTGTLTKGELEVTSWDSTCDSTVNCNDLIYSLEEKSQHPIARAIRKYLLDSARGTQKPKQLPLSQVKEETGAGVSGEYQNKIYQISRLKTQDQISVSAHTQIGLYCENQLLCNITLKDQLKNDSLETVTKLQSMGLSVHLLSGDNRSVAEKIASDLNIPKQNVHSELTPEQKTKVIKKNAHSMMVGDGANDTLALAASDVGVAVQGSIDISMKACDVYITSEKLNLISDLISVSKETIKILKRNFAVSVGYNVIGAALSVSGYVTPLGAALIMPLSSLTALLSTVIATQEIRKIMAKGRAL